MKNSYYALILAMATTLLSGCLDNGSRASPPSDVIAVAGDSRAIITWTPSPGVEYWLFTATDPALTAFNWAGLANGHGYVSVVSPFYMCGLITSTAGTANWTPYYFAMNGRISGGPGGSSSPTTPALTPYDASAKWQASNTALSSQNIYGVGYASLTTCSNNTSSAAGAFAAVGASGTIFISNDGKSWNLAESVPPGLPDLYAVTGNAANLNDPTDPALLWVAVGDGGVSVFSPDGINWQLGRVALGNPALRSLTHAGGTFLAVGDGGTIVSTADGINWTPEVSTSSSNLRGVTHGAIYVAVGDSGTILTSSNGSSWGQVHPSGLNSLTTLRQVASVGSIYVAVGDAGTIATSVDGGNTWSAQTLPPPPTQLSPPNLVSVAGESLIVAAAVGDPLLPNSAIPYAQFVALDSSGNTYTSVNGLTWLSASGIGMSQPNAMVSSGFGYVAAGFDKVLNANTTASAF